MNDPDDGTDDGTDHGPDGAGTRSGAGEQEPVGSVGDEAAKLLGAFSDWAREQGTDYASTAAGAAGAFADAVQDVNDHVATGGEDCRYCPVCQVIHVVRQTSPEVREHLTLAASSLLQAAAGLLATNTANHPKPSTVEKIDLDAAADWEDE